MNLSYSAGGKTSKTSLRELLRLFEQLRATGSGHACLTVHYCSKAFHIYFGEFSSAPPNMISVEFAGPTPLDGGSGSVTVEAAKAALTAISRGDDPQEEIQRAAADWGTYREYEGLD